MSGMSPALKFIIGWIVVIMLLVVIAKTRIGHNIVYYFLWLAFASLVVANYKFFQSLFQPQTSEEAGQQAGQTAAALTGVAT